MEGENETPADGASTDETLNAEDTPAAEAPKGILEELAGNEEVNQLADALRHDNPTTFDWKTLTPDQRLVVLQFYNATRDAAAKGEEGRKAETTALDQKRAEAEAEKLRHLDEQAKLGDSTAALDKLIAELKAEAAKPISDTIDPLSEEAIAAKIEKGVAARVAAIFERQKAEATAVQTARQTAADTARHEAAVRARNAAISEFVNSHEEFDDPEFVKEMESTFRELNGDPKADGYKVRVPVERVFSIVQNARAVANSAQTTETARRTVQRERTVSGATMPKFRSEQERTEWLIKNPQAARELYEENLRRANAS
jgi:hypothetical protein